MGIQYDHFGIPLQAYIDYAASEDDQAGQAPEEEPAHCDTGSETGKE